MEGTLRRAVWFFRERPRTAYVVTALAVVALVGGGLLLVAPAVRGTRRREEGEEDGSHLVLSSTTMRQLLTAAWKRATAAGAVLPLAGDSTITITDGGIPVRLLLPNRC